MRATVRWWMAAVAVAALAAHLPALGAGFVWDDVVVQREHLPRLRSARDALFPPAGIPAWPVAYYRPTVLVSYQLERRVNDALWGPPASPEESLEPRRAFLPHLVTLLTHAAASVAVTALAARCLGGQASPAAAGLAGLLFAVHPVHSESVASVAGRSDSLATLLLLLALLGAVRGRSRDSVGWQAAGAGCFLLALGAKETALVGLVLLPLTLRLTQADAGTGSEAGRRLPLTSLTLFGGAAACYLALRWANAPAPGGLLPPDPALAAVQGLAALAFCIRKALWPWPVTPFVPSLPGAAASFAALAVGGSALALAAAARRRGRRLPLFCALWFLAACLPALPVAMRNVAAASVAERYVYLPSVALALAAGGALGALDGPWRRRAAAPIGALLAAGAVTCWTAALVWKSDDTLLAALTQREDVSWHAYPWVALGDHEMAKGRYAEAERAYRRALASSGDPSGRHRTAALAGLADALQAEAGGPAPTGDQGPPRPAIGDLSAPRR